MFIGQYGMWEEPTWDHSHVTFVGRPWGQVWKCQDQGEADSVPFVVPAHEAGLSLLSNCLS